MKKTKIPKKPRTRLPLPDDFNVADLMFKRERMMRLDQSAFFYLQHTVVSKTTDFSAHMRLYIDQAYAFASAIEDARAKYVPVQENCPTTCQTPTADPKPGEVLVPTCTGCGQAQVPSLKK
jgi:hypothetical protein